MSKGYGPAIRLARQHFDDGGTPKCAPVQSSAAANCGAMGGTGASVGTSSTDDVSGDIQNLYQNILGRTGSPDEVNYWANAINSGASTLCNVGVQFLQSPEYNNQISNLTQVAQNGTSDANQPGIASGPTIGLPQNSSTWFGYAPTQKDYNALLTLGMGENAFKTSPEQFAAIYEAIGNRVAAAQLLDPQSYPGGNSNTNAFANLLFSSPKQYAGLGATANIHQMMTSNDPNIVASRNAAITALNNYFTTGHNTVLGSQTDWRGMDPVTGDPSPSIFKPGGEIPGSQSCFNTFFNGSMSDRLAQLQQQYNAVDSSVPNAPILTLLPGTDTYGVLPGCTGCLATVNPNLIGQHPPTITPSPNPNSSPDDTPEGGIADVAGTGPLSTNPGGISTNPGAIPAAGPSGGVVNPLDTSGDIGIAPSPLNLGVNTTPLTGTNILPSNLNPSSGVGNWCSGRLGILGSPFGTGVDALGPSISNPFTSGPGGTPFLGGLCLTGGIGGGDFKRGGHVCYALQLSRSKGYCSSKAAHKIARAMGGMIGPNLSAPQPTPLDIAHRILNAPGYNGQEEDRRANILANIQNRAGPAITNHEYARGGRSGYCVGGVTNCCCAMQNSTYDTIDIGNPTAPTAPTDPTFGATVANIADPNSITGTTASPFGGLHGIANSADPFGTLANTAMTSTAVVAPDESPLGALNISDYSFGVTPGIAADPNSIDATASVDVGTTPGMASDPGAASATAGNVGGFSGNTGNTGTNGLGGFGCTGNEGGFGASCGAAGMGSDAGGLGGGPGSTGGGSCSGGCSGSDGGDSGGGCGGGCGGGGDGGGGCNRGGFVSDKRLKKQRKSGGTIGYGHDKIICEALSKTRKYMVKNPRHGR